MNIKHATLSIVAIIGAMIMSSAKADDGGWKAESAREQRAYENLVVATTRAQQCDTVADCRREMKNLLEAVYQHETALIDKQAAYTGFVVASDVAKSLVNSGHIDARTASGIEYEYMISASKNGTRIERK